MAIMVSAHCDSWKLCEDKHFWMSQACLLQGSWSADDVIGKFLVLVNFVCRYVSRNPNLAIKAKTANDRKKKVDVLAQCNDLRTNWAALRLGLLCCQPLQKSQASAVPSKATTMGDTELLRQSDTSIDLYNKDKDSVMVNVKVEGNSTVPDSICYSPSKDVDASVEMSAGGACSSLQSDTPKEPVTDATCVTDGIERYQTTDTIGQAVMISGDIFHRWQQVGNVHGLGSHSDIAAFLLTCYENSLPGPRVTGSERSLCPMCLAPLYCRNCNPVTHSEHDPVQKGRSTSRRSRGACKVNSVMGEDSGREHQTDADNDREEAVRKEIKMENHSDDEDGDADIHTFDDVESVKTPAGTARKAGRKTETTAGKRRGRKLQKPKKRDVQKSGLQPVMVDDEDTVRPYRCPECSKRYKSRMQCLNHLKCHDPCNFIYHCDQCPMTFYQRSYLKQHILRRHSDKTQVQVACEDCGKMLSSYQALICHRRIHTGELPYQCRDCDSKFRQYANLMRHQRTHHSTERPFSCTQCGAAFAVKNDLDLHLPTHSDLRPFLCQDCGSSFKTKGTLKEHMMCHTNTRTVPCHLCEQMFHNQSQLRKHLRSAKHFNVRDVVCSVCGARFNRQESLKQHMMLHTGHRPVECEECGKKFRNKGLMSVHMRIHTGERPAICDVCGRGFQTTGNMRKHRANVHKDAPTLPKHTPVRRSVNDIFHPRKLELFTFPVQAEHEDVSSPMAT